MQEDPAEDPAEPMHPSQPLPPPPRFPQEPPPEEEESTGKSESGGEGASVASMSGVPRTDARPAGTFNSQTVGTERADANGPRETTRFPGSACAPGSRALGGRPVLGSGAPQKRARRRPPGRPAGDHPTTRTPFGEARKSLEGLPQGQGRRAIARLSIQRTGTCVHTLTRLYPTSLEAGLAGADRSSAATSLPLRA